MFAIIVFRSRTDTMSFSQILKSYGVKNQIINTPRQIAVSCGISVKIDINMLTNAQNILSRRKFNTFAGIFKATAVGGGLVIERI